MTDKNEVLQKLASKKVPSGFRLIGLDIQNENELPYLVGHFSPDGENLYMFRIKLETFNYIPLQKKANEDAGTDRDDTDDNASGIA